MQSCGRIPGRPKRKFLKGWRTDSAGAERTIASSGQSRRPRKKCTEGSDMNEFEYWTNDAEETAFTMDRRRFLKTTGSGIFLFFKIRDFSFFTQEGPGRPNLKGGPSDFNAYLKIGEDGRVSCYTGKIEMGQGIVTSLAQMLADELDVHIDDVDMVMGDTD